jgi:hypothetical protein
MIVSKFKLVLLKQRSNRRNTVNFVRQALKELLKGNCCDDVIRKESSKTSIWLMRMFVEIKVLLTHSSLILILLLLPLSPPLPPPFRGFHLTEKEILIRGLSKNSTLSN